MLVITFKWAYVQIPYIIGNVVSTIRRAVNADGYFENHYKSGVDCPFCQLFGGGGRALAANLFEIKDSLLDVT